jgi:hypothetical protein
VGRVGQLAHKLRLTRRARARDAEPFDALARGRDVGRLGSSVMVDRSGVFARPRGQRIE